MELLAILELDAVRPAKSRVLLALEHCESDDSFQQLLSIDSALEALRETVVPLARDNDILNGHDLAKSEAFADHTKLVEKFEELQTNARHAFNLRARKSLPEADIQSFPDEVLLVILHNFESSLDETTFRFDDDFSANTKTVQNIRLTCRRLCEISSHLLVARVNVSPNLSSLEHLDRIASHPTIPQGIRLLCVHMPVYSAAIAENFQRFSRKCYERVSDMREEYDHRMLEETIGHTQGHEEGVHDFFRRVNLIFPSLEPRRVKRLVKDGAPIDEPVLTLQRAHEHYRALYQQQNEIIQGGHFARAVAAAAARSHSSVFVRALVADRHLATDSDLIVRSAAMHKGHEWWEDEADQVAKMYQPMLYELPLAVDAAGATLAALGLSLNLPRDITLEITKEQVSGLDNVSKSLKSFRFFMDPDHEDSDEPLRHPEEMKGLCTYLSAVMGQRIIPDLSLDVAFITKFDVGSLQPNIMGSLLASRSWERLETLTLESCHIHFNELERLMSLLKPGVQMNLIELRLLSGT
ncbi:hypothetical protein Daus18300_013838 [Diaporthe australafricana]|uniref:F-box domain-containing protein n=1 Tax=Diaporthe australafricana TaxID=127596 RepID=A0ABR3VXJ0_9PEZI